MGTCLSAAAENDGSLGIAVTADLHYNSPREQLSGDINDGIYWYANRRAAMEDESGFIIDEVLRQCAGDSDIEYVLICGDMADNGSISFPSQGDAIKTNISSFMQKLILYFTMIFRYMARMIGINA